MQIPRSSGRAISLSILLQTELRPQALHRGIRSNRLFSAGRSQPMCRRVGSSWADGFSPNAEKADALLACAAWARKARWMTPALRPRRLECSSSFLVLTPDLLGRTGRVLPAYA